MCMKNWATGCSFRPSCQERNGLRLAYALREGYGDALRQRSVARCPAVWPYL